MNKFKGKNIWIALVDDWELRGDGSGCVNDLQYNNALKLMELYNRLKIKATFNIEVMQQLAFEKYADDYKEIKEQCDCWIKTIQIMGKKGFDIQLHVHPQWHNAFYNGKSWQLDKKWNITSYPVELIEKFISDSIKYLNSKFKFARIVSFRGCEWGVCCPSNPLFDILEKNGIKVDISVVNGLHFDNEHIKLDYTNLDSPYLPYYPDYDDARKISKRKTGIIEIPTQSYIKDWKFIFKKTLWKLLPNRISSEVNNTKRRPNVNAHHSKGPGSRKFFGAMNSTRHIIMDISNLDIYSMIIGFDIVIKRALKVKNAGIVPLVFVSHTKDLNYDKLWAIEKSIKFIKKKFINNIKFVTMKEIIENIDLVKPVNVKP